MVDWTFEDAEASSGLHSIHPYPARFIPHIPRTLIEIFHPLVGGPVLDPFCGSGATLVESQLAGIESCGIDLNPIAALVSRVKTNPPRQRLGPLAEAAVETARSTGHASPPNIPRLGHWFSPGATEALAKLTGIIHDVRQDSAQDALRVALSRIIVRVSRQDSDTRYAAVDRSVGEEDVYDAFVESARKLDSTFEQEQANVFRSWAPCHVIANDTLTVEPVDLPYDFGLIVTSPPYPNAYEYWLYHKYRMYWLGEDPIAVRQAEIGARAHYFKRNPATAADFHWQMGKCFELFRKVTLPEALVCVVIGRSIIRGTVVDNASILVSAGHAHGFKLLTSGTRRIPATRKSINPRHGNVGEETVLVFQKTNHVDR
ncbi:MAG: RNA methyltransferase [Chloroflexota bacterium]|nr:RNA methyltransferase [Chloroflexota bacterium]